MPADVNPVCGNVCHSTILFILDLLLVTKSAGLLLEFYPGMDVSMTNSDMGSGGGGTSTSGRISVFIFWLPTIGMITDEY